MLSYLKKLHCIHVINPRVSGVQVQKYLENFRRIIVATPFKDSLFLKKKKKIGKLPEDLKK